MPTPPSPNSKRITAQEIAAATGVSQTTVSLVLNERAQDYRISEATQAKIRKAAEELGYRGNVLARSLRGAATRSVGMLWSIAGAPTSARIVSEIVARLGSHDYTCYLGDHRGTSKSARELLDDFLQRQIDAAVVSISPAMARDPALIEALKQTPALVLVGHTRLKLPYDQVVTPRETAFEAIGKQLARDGRKRVAFLGAAASNASKITGLRAGLRAHDQTLHHTRVLSQDDQSPQAVAWVMDRLDAAHARGVKFDALVCANDDLAIAAMAWLRQHGVSCPADVAVIGANNSAIAPYQHPPLASIDWNEATQVEAVSDMLLRRLQHPRAEVITQVIDARFVARASSDAPCSASP